MFCPQRLVEYRPGFTHSTDCDVDLVPELPLTSSDSFESNPGGLLGDEGNPLCAFWRGDDARLHAELCTVLDEAGIPDKTVRREDHPFKKLSGLPDWRAVFAVRKSRNRGEGRLRDGRFRYDDGQSLNAPALIPDLSTGMHRLPETLTPSEEENIPGPPEVGDEAEGELAGGGIEVWSGEDTSLGDMLIASLRENKIRVRRETSHGRQSLLVSSEQQPKAREIVK